MSKNKLDSGGMMFKVSPRIFSLLGDELIRDASLAVFELVKNSYDANAKKCEVTLENIGDKSSARIVVEDDGIGMSEETLRNIWMEIGTSNKDVQRKLGARTAAPFNRFPLGEKGLGRLSVHKLGHSISLITRVQGGEELVVTLDWDRLEGLNDMEDALVQIERRSPLAFKGEKHGTRIEVTKIRESWGRGDLRRLHRAVNALCSPYKSPENFKVTLSAPGQEDWLKGLFTAENARQCAQYFVEGSFEGSEGHFAYRFEPPPTTEGQLSSRDESVNFRLARKEGRKSFSIDLSEFDIGKIDFKFWIFDRDPTILRLVSDDVKGLKDFLDDNGGIRIYRDGIRVYDFGEPGNDWLNLDMRRVNMPTAKTSNNQILGVLRLSADSSSSLREKSNREGFIENSAYKLLQNAVISLLTQVEAEKTKDQKRLRAAIGKGTGQKLFEKLSELREVLDRKGVLAEVEPKLKSIEKELEVYKSQLLHAAVPGLTIGVMLHGAEKILEELREASKIKILDSDRVRDLVDMLYRAMRPVTNLLKNPGTTTTFAKSLVKEALFSAELRLKRHGIELIDGLQADGLDFKIKGSKQMLIATLTNLIDNSIHWLEVKAPVKKYIYIGTTNSLEGGFAIVVADNGPGFGNDSPEDLMTPFFTRRNGGMGLGLYIAGEVVRINGGKIIFPEDDDVELPGQIDGAVVAIQFPEVAS